MAIEENLEVYRQRYDTFRHLDTLRWQMLQTALATSGVVLAFGKDSIVAQAIWPWITVGAILITLGIARFRIDRGLASNGLALKAAAEKIGDREIPHPAIWPKSVSIWISLAMIGVGLLVIATTPWR